MEFTSWTENWMKLRIYFNMTVDGWGLILSTTVARERTELRILFLARSSAAVN